MNRIAAHIKDRFYASSAWKKLARYKLSTCYVCECPVCKEYGYELPATEVHHIVDIDTDWNRRLEYDNLMSVTHDHHSRLTMTSLNTNRDKQKKDKVQYDCITERLLNVVITGGTVNSITETR